MIEKLYGESSETMKEDMAEGMGFEPTVACATHAFQACSFDRSDTPLSFGGRHYNGKGLKMQYCFGREFWL